MKAKINNRWEIDLPENRMIFHREQDQWEQKRLNSLFKNIKKDDLVVDIGTELGDYATLFALWGARVVLIEPQPKYWPTIKHYFDSNKVEPYKCFAGFASNTNFTKPPLADFKIGNKGLWPKAAFEPLEDWHGFRNIVETGISTPQIRLSSLVKEPVNLITIDVEGAEFEALKGARQILIDYHPVVYISIHPEMMFRDWNQTPQDLFNYMESVGYDIHEHLETDHEEHHVFANSASGGLK